MDNTHHFGSGFAVHRIFEPCIKEFNPVSERISTLTINTSPINICLINGHAPTEVKDDNAKDIFYDELTETYESITGNVIKIVLGDFNAKCGREPQYFPCIGKESLHSNSNDNGQRLIAFAISNGLTVSSTTFPHKNIHKVTWRSPDAKTLNQIDHVLIQTRYRSTIHDVRSHRGADCDTDHYLVIAKLRSKLKSQSRLKQGKRAKLNLELLKDENVRKNYENEVMKNLKENNVQMDVDLDWEKVSNAVKKAAATSIGELKRSKNTWNNDVCRIVVDKRRKAIDNFIKHNSQITKEVYIPERKICQGTLQREKRKFFSNILQIAEKDHTQELEVFLESLNSISNSTLYGLQSETKTDKC
ncbi:Endonuclease/exonuclease/phosphatase [Cinara cedri]|uniref:Endonuclease/exonuclease/phosphatase n=1 Tax=Cinara cedri TaxID=506608 RepID=A0A5E4MG09_9HEMI|nr:Endonuclease/exonuclease/phosphatase [Cinara cedri]